MGWIFTHIKKILREYVPEDVLRADAGFSLIEIAVVTSIMVILLTVVLISFPQLNERILIRKAGQQLELDLRVAQNKALSVRTVQCPAPLCPPFGGPVTPKGFGLHLTLNAANYIIYADLNNNQSYDLGTDLVIQTTPFARGLKITDMKRTLTPLPVDVCPSGPDVDIGFASPAARMQIYCNGVISGAAQAIVTITSPGVSIQTSIVTIITTGQILIR